MSIPPTKKPNILGQAVDLATGGFNTAAQLGQNIFNRLFAKKERERQYDTELEFWRMNNQYNHPSAQMARLREAGLNPHLVYGTGAVANSSSAPSAPGRAQWQGQAPQLPERPAAAMLSDYVDLEAKGLQNDNFRAQNTLLLQESALKQLEQLKKAFDLDIDYTTKESIIKRIISGANVVENQDAATYNQNVRDMELHTIEMQLKQAGLRGQNLLNSMNNERDKLMKAGLNPNDPIVLRFLGQILMEAFGDNPIGKGVEWIKSNFKLW